MKENQRTEFKRQWYDDCLKEICAFANAQGGSLYIGIEDDGTILGVDNADKLMEDIPAKMRNILGIVGEVLIQHDKDNTYLRINIEPNLTPISYKGRFYQRSGNRKIELTGPSLTSFLMSKTTGQSWDEVIIQGATLDDLDENTIYTYKQEAENKGRIPKATALDNKELLERLKVIIDGKVTRAAIILFGKDVQRYFINAKFKIGKFSNKSAQVLTDTLLEDNLIELIYQIPDILYTKYLTKHYSYPGMIRQETGEYPELAIREMVLNALIHRDYAKSPDIQMRIYDNRVSLWNVGGLPQGVSIEKLQSEPQSYPRNPLIANVCYRGGYIENWGSGLGSIHNACKQANLPEPKITEALDGFSVALYRDRYTLERLQQLRLSERAISAILYVKEKGRITNSEYQALVGVSRNTASSDLQKLVDAGYLLKSGTKGSSVFYELE